MIDQFDVCQLLDDEVFHIQAITGDEKIDLFIQKLSNSQTWEISNSDKVKMMQHLGICSKELYAFINVMHYCYDNIHDLHWVNANEIKHQKCKKRQQEK